MFLFEKNFRNGFSICDAGPASPQTPRGARPRAEDMAAAAAQDAQARFEHFVGQVPWEGQCIFCMTLLNSQGLSFVFHIQERGLP